MKNPIEMQAYAMADAYCRESSRDKAIERAKTTHPDADEKTLDAMWRAIDAYVDIENGDT